MATAKKKRHTPAEISAMLEKADALAAEGRIQMEITRALGISVMTLHRWRKARPPRSGARAPTYPSGLLSGSDRRRRAAELQLENTRLRKLVTDLLLEKMRLEEET